MRSKPQWGPDTVARCPSCNEDIKVGFRGPSGLVEHEGKSKCLKTIEKKKKADELEAKRSKNAIGMYFRPKQQPLVVSTVAEPAKLPPVPFRHRENAAGRSPSVSASSPVSEFRQLSSLPSSPTQIGKHAGTTSLASLRKVAAALPMSVPMGTDGDSFVAGGEIDPDEDIWEQGDMALNRLLAGRSPAQIAPLIRRGDYGIDSVIDFFEFLLENNVDSALLEDKMDRLKNAMLVL